MLAELLDVVCYVFSEPSAGAKELQDDKFRILLGASKRSNSTKLSTKFLCK